SDEAGVRALIDAPTAAFFEANHKLSVHGHGQDVLVFRGWRTAKPEEIGKLLDEAMTVFRFISAGSLRARGSA
ncbi:MAG: cullin, partial [Verrucomicrobiota bacterium]|nr:cullin [Verrucomicrobiota bacterium]